MSSSNIITVSALNRRIKSLLEQNWTRVWLSGEISNLATPASGHWYFTLKDERSQIRCAMFKSRASKVAFRPEHGMQVLVRANLTLYEPRGDLQLVVESMQPAGDGLLQQQFEALKLKLAAEGLFASAAKQPLPHPIKRLGVITSPTGAAIKDVLSVLKRRDPLLDVVIYPTLVQGREAQQALCDAIAHANHHREVDCLLLTRGGGSLEDLWAFNEERVARAIFASQLPIVSAVGHEVDTTISDYVADLRAPTPSAAAELLSQDAKQRVEQLHNQQRRLNQAMNQRLHHGTQRLALLQARLNANHPSRKLDAHAQRLDELCFRLNSSMTRKVDNHHLALTRLSGRLDARHPGQRLGHGASTLTALSHRLHQSMEQKLERTSLQLDAQIGALDAVSPLAVLARGYSILQDDKGKPIKSATDVSQGDSLRATLHQGQIHCQVTKVQPDD